MEKYLVTTKQGVIFYVLAGNYPQAYEIAKTVLFEKKLALDIKEISAESEINVFGGVYKVRVKI